MIKTFFTTLLGVVLLGATTMLAQLPQTMVLQGQLFQQNGDPVADGDYPVIVSFHAGATTDDNIVVCNPCTVNFRMGVFTLTLGEESSPLPPMDKPYWVQLTVNGEALTPRLRLNSVPYAMSATTATNVMGVVPVGAILPFAGPTKNIPKGWMLCDGRAMSSRAVPQLFAALSTTWGDGSTDANVETDFNLPDLRGMFLRGSDRTRDEVAMTRHHSINGAAPDPDATLGTYSGTYSGQVSPPFRTYQTGLSDGQTRAIDEMITMRTPNAAVNYIIRVR